MTSEQILALDYAKLVGEVTGTLEGLLFFDLPEDVKAKMQKKIEELKEIEINIA